jgi:hypothetical protein
VVHLLLFGITQGSVVFIIFAFIIFAFIIIALFFFILVVIVVVVILQQLLSFLHFFSYRYHDHNLKGILLWRNVLRRVGLRLRLRWQIPWRQLSSGLTSSPLMGGVVRANHLKFGNRRE